MMARGLDIVIEGVQEYILCAQALPGPLKSAWVLG